MESGNDSNQVASFLVDTAKLLFPLLLVIAALMYALGYFRTTISKKDWECTKTEQVVSLSFARGTVFPWHEVREECVEFKRRRTATSPH